MSDKTTGPNDKITGVAVELGYCCPYGMLCQMSGKRDSHKRVANKTGLSEVTIQFNRRKIRKGQMVCSGLETCQKDKFPTEESQ